MVARNSARLGAWRIWASRARQLALLAVGLLLELAALLLDAGAEGPLGQGPVRQFPAGAVGGRHAAVIPAPEGLHRQLLVGGIVGADLAELEAIGVAGLLVVGDGGVGGIEQFSDLLAAFIEIAFDQRLGPGLHHPRLAVEEEHTDAGGERLKDREGDEDRQGDVGNRLALVPVDHRPAAPVAEQQQQGGEAEGVGNRALPAPGER